jgi:hypothetical protein
MSKSLKSGIATVANMGIDSKAKLHGDVKKYLVTLIENEFTNRVSTDQKAIEIKTNEIRERIIRKYKAKEAFSEAKKLRETADKIDKDMNAQGFSKTVYGSNDITVSNEEYQREVDLLSKQGNDINTFKHKILTRLMLSTTIGEATVIMREVLGNGLIPTLNQNAIEFTPEGKTAEERSDA